MAPAKGTAVQHRTLPSLFRRVHHLRIHGLLTATTCCFLLGASLPARAQNAPATPTQETPTQDAPAAPPAAAQAPAGSSSSASQANASNSGAHRAAYSIEVSPHQRDVAVSGFAQISRDVNSNFILQRATKSGGGLLSFRQELKPWFGYELNYGYTHLTDTYNRTDPIPHGMSEFSLAYLLQAPPFRGVQAFATIGGGAVVQTPASTTISTGEKPTTTASPAFVLGLGVNIPNLYQRIGLRLQYRAVKAKSPDFDLLSLNTRRLRTANEPTIGLYYRF